jgi:hypothetical protein
MTLAATIAYATPRIHVHATSTIDARASRSNGKVFILGTLVDDSGHPLVKSLRASAHEGSPQGALVPVEPCSGPTASDAHGTDGCTWIHTDRSGRFCASTSNEPHALSFWHIEWPGDSDMDGAKLDITADPSRRELELRFVPEPKVLDLDKGPIELDAILRAASEERGSSLDPTPLVLTNEQGIELGRTEASLGNAKFTVEPAALGPPGRGELRIHFAGDLLRSAATHVAPIERRATVRLAVVGAPGGLLPPADPEDGAAVTVTATTANGTPVRTGIVEATTNGKAVGAAPLSEGRAELVVTFPAGEPTPAILRIRYASDAPWYLEGDVVTARMPVRAKRPWRSAILLLSSLGVILWLALTRRSSGTRIHAPSRGRSLSTGEPGLELVQSGGSPFVGWSGRVIDGHDGVALPGAEVRVERPSFKGRDVLAATFSHDGGRFELRCDSARKGDRLLVSAALHSTLERTLPDRGELEVVLVQRRRALLDRLVAWALAEGSPFRGPPEPTPGSVAFEARRARDVQARGAESWARAVEGAAFGPDPVSAEVESEIEKIAPHRR